MSAWTDGSSKGIFLNIKDGPISGRRRLLLWVAACIGAFLGMMLPNLFTMRDAIVVLLMLSHLFPIGLVWLVNSSWCDYRAPLRGILISFIWAAYLAISIKLFVTKERRKYLLIYGILCLLLIFNVTGCYLAIYDPKARLIDLPSC